MMPAPPVLIVMGVTGAGKSTIAAALNAKLGWAFQEGDDLHPAANIAKMHAGIPLTDADRAPWLAAVKAWIDARVAEGEPGLITCSALKRSYRDYLVAGHANVRILYLRASQALLEAHLQHREGHFMPATLLDSQLATLEEPAADERPITVDVRDNVADTVDEIIGRSASF
jgi:carbohydrate kinase (thermoresistant glucokinase family)